MGIIREENSGAAFTSFLYRKEMPEAFSSSSFSFMGTPAPTTAIDSWSFDRLFDAAGMGQAERGAFTDTADIAAHCGGWQSWSAGWELRGSETLPRKVRLIPELITLTASPADRPDAPAEERIAHFIMYLRARNHYLCIASKQAPGLPPVRYRVRMAERRIIPEVFCPLERNRDRIAEIAVFYADGFFALKDTLKALYRKDAAFAANQFLSAPSNRLKDTVPGGYTSWYHHYTNINEAVILEDLAGMGNPGGFMRTWYLDRGKPAVFQIDDGWERVVGEWEPHGKRFPNGLAPIAAAVEQAGMVPGLWLAPCIVTRRAKVLRERPSWVLRDERGRPVVAGFNHLWDGRYYCLDISREDVLDYLEGLMNTVIETWGFRFLKIDFLYAGALPGNFAGRGNFWTHYERACARLFAKKTNAAGLPVAYLGCGAPLGLSFRHFPLCRIGADTSGDWEWGLVRLLGHTGRPSAYINLMDTIGRSFLDGAVYRNDPDVIFLQRGNCSLSENERELIALVNFLLAGQLMVSGDPSDKDRKDAAFTRRITALYDALADDEYGAVRIAWEVFRLESRSGATAGLINLRGRPYALRRDSAPDMYADLECADLLVDHRVGRNPDQTVFAPHSITLFMKQPSPTVP
ncbi:MAG: alpha-galactosidase [Spirochaetaceae bacterium]|nr:alpha-galactosidase [Spirochaetaceae bacterium]